MRSTRFGLLLCTLLLNIPVWARQAQTPVIQPQPTSPQQTQPVTTLPPASQDPQALSVVNQALTAAGGTSAIIGITDFTGTGTITYHLGMDQDVEGSVTIRGSGLGQLRLDAILPSGVRSVAIDGLISEKAEDGAVRQYQSQAPMLPTRLVLPYLPLAPIVSSSAYNLSYRGIVEIDGHSLHDIQVQRVLPGIVDPNGWFRKSTTMDFFIDPSTFQVLVMEDAVNKSLIRRVRYSDYRLANGVLVPFAISEEVDGRPVSRIHLDQIKLNTGLQDSDFQL